MLFEPIGSTFPIQLQKHSVMLLIFGDLQEAAAGERISRVPNHLFFEGIFR